MICRTALPSHSYALVDVNRQSDNATGTYIKGTAFQITAAQRSGALLFEASDVSTIVIGNNFSSAHGFKLKNGTWEAFTASSSTISIGSGNDLVLIGITSSQTGYTTYNITIS